MMAVTFRVYLVQYKAVRSLLDNIPNYNMMRYLLKRSTATTAVTY